MRRLLVGMLLLCTACSVTQPVAVIRQNGGVLKGTTTPSLAGGTFTATDGILTCSGTYDNDERSRTISFPVFCSDGRKGTVIATRGGDGTTGSGMVRMSDGEEAAFVFGPAANTFSPVPMRPPEHPDLVPPSVPI